MTDVTRFKCVTHHGRLHSLQHSLHLVQRLKVDLATVSPRQLPLPPCQQWIWVWSNLTQTSVYTDVKTHTWCYSNMHYFFWILYFIIAHTFFTVMGWLDPCEKNKLNNSSHGGHGRIWFIYYECIEVVFKVSTNHTHSHTQKHSLIWRIHCYFWHATFNQLRELKC